MYNNKHYSEEEINFLVKNADNIGTKLCSKLLQRTESGIISKLRRLKIPIHPNPLPNFDTSSVHFDPEQFELKMDFENHPHPKELAYYLGYFWADGYITSSDGLILELTKDDLLAIKPFFDKLAKFSLYTRDRDGRQPQASIYIKSSSASKALRDLGKYSHSIESHQKILNFIPSVYHVYFFRGLIDGDGCFYYNELSNLFQFSISNSFNFDWDYIIKYFDDKGIYFHIKRSESKSGNSSVVRCCNRCEIKKLIKWLYEVDDNIWLERKHSKAIQMLNLI